MTEENVAPPAPTVYADQEVGVKAGEGMEQVQEPSKDETTNQVEDTTQKHEEEASDKSKGEKQTEAEGEAKHSSKLIAEMGEDRKRLAGELVDLARESDTAADKVRELVKADPKMEKLIKTKFGEDYDRIMSGESLQTEPKEEVDLEKFKEEARVEARAEILLKEAESTKTKQLEMFAQQNGLNSDETEQLKEHAEILEAKYEYETALETALLIVSRDKASASKAGYQPPTGGQETEVAKDKGAATPGLETFVNRYMPGRNAKDVAEGLNRVEERIQPDGTFRLGD